MRFDEMTPEQHLALASKGGTAPRKKKARREFCNRGHRLTDDNVDIVERKSYSADRSKVYVYMTYRCHECMLEVSRKRKRALIQAARQNRIAGSDDPMYCKRGHTLIAPNLRLYKHKRTLPSGVVRTSFDKVCLQCRREDYHNRTHNET